MTRTTLGTFFVRASLFASLLAVPLLGGCGADGGPAPGVPAPLQVSGVVRSVNGVGLIGYSIVFDRGGAPPSSSTMTGIDGGFTLLVPVSAVTGQDTVSVLDGSGRLSTTVPVTVNSGTGPVTLAPIPVAPPPPPAG